MDDVIFIEMLKQRNLLTVDLEEQLLTRATRTEKANQFLEKTIDQSVHTGDINPLNNLLTAMSDEIYISSNVLKKLAAKIKHGLNEETSPNVQVTGQSSQVNVICRSCVTCILFVEAMCICVHIHR